MAKKLKQAKKDFERQDLPSNRWQVFCDVYKNRFSLIINLGLTMLMFCLPMIAISMLTIAQSAEINNQYAQNLITSQQASIQLVQILNASNVALIVALVVVAIGLAGISNVVKRLVWQEGVLFKSDFGKGVKSNGITFCITAVICGALNYLLQYFVNVGYFENGDAMQFALVACIVASVFFALAVPFILAQTTLYNLGYFKKLSNAFLLAMRTFFPTLGVVLLNVAPFLLLMIDNYIAHVFALILLPILVVPTLVIVDTLYAHHVLDKFVNKDNFPEIYKKGLNVNADN